MLRPPYPQKRNPVSIEGGSPNSLLEEIQRLYFQNMTKRTNVGLQIEHFNSSVLRMKRERLMCFNFAWSSIRHHTRILVSQNQNHSWVTRCVWLQHVRKHDKQL